MNKPRRWYEIGWHIGIFEWFLIFFWMTAGTGKKQTSGWWDAIQSLAEWNNLVCLANYKQFSLELLEYKPQVLFKDTRWLHKMLNHDL